MNSETSNERKQTTVFLALPCAEAFTEINDYIKTVFVRAGTEPIVIEDRTETTYLWDAIMKQIDSAKYFVADISSLSPNIMLELGYATRRKRPKHIAVLISKNVRTPSNLSGLKCLEYGTISELRRILVEWVKENMSLGDHRKLDSFEIEERDYWEYFKDSDRFLKLWSCPSGSYFYLTSEGLHFTNAHFPIVTTHFALLQDHEFEFKARIDKSTLGWIVKGTRPYDSYLPTFCVMFNINQDRKLLPHILNVEKKTDPPHYIPFEKERKQVPLAAKKGWFTLTTRVIRHTITIFNNENKIFDADFTNKPYKEFYEDFRNKQGQVGFRCFRDEEGTVNYVRLRAIG